MDSRRVILVIAATGFVFDSFMAILNASVLEVEGVTDLYAGAAIGFGTMVRSLGGTFSPPLGNSLTVLGPSVPFLFWGGMGLLAVILFALLPRPEKATARGIETGEVVSVSQTRP